VGEEADAPQPVSRIMVILKAPERQECPTRPLKAISPEEGMTHSFLSHRGRVGSFCHTDVCVCVCVCVCRE